VFASVDDEEYESLVEVWVDALDRADAAEADLLHLHHLTPANEAAGRAFPALPVVGQLHGTELAMLRILEAGAPGEGASFVLYVHSVISASREARRFERLEVEQLWSQARRRQTGRDIQCSSRLSIPSARSTGWRPRFG
jgi:hypothetical protein